MKKLFTAFALAGLIGMVGCEGQQDDAVIIDDPVLEEPTTPPVVTEPVAPPLSEDTAAIELDSMPDMADSAATDSM